MNLPKWRKIILTILVTICSAPTLFAAHVLTCVVAAVALSLVSGFGGLLSWYIPKYVAKGATHSDISALMTYPTMFMGVGNLVCMPLALAIGRRPVFLGSLLVLVAAAILAAYSESYKWHLGARFMLGFAAGQSEALVPMMIQVNPLLTALELKWSANLSRRFISSMSAPRL